jgi:hypothetical protein
MTAVVQSRLPNPPQRIVSLLPSLTETVCELGQCQRLVGWTGIPTYPASARALPQVGGGLDPNIEAVVALKPDVVLMATARALASDCRRWASRWWRWNPRPMPTCAACWRRWASCWVWTMPSASGA